MNHIRSSEKALYARKKYIGDEANTRLLEKLLRSVYIDISCNANLYIS